MFPRKEIPRALMTAIIVLILLVMACSSDDGVGPPAKNPWPQLCLQTGPPGLSVTFWVDPADTSGASSASPGECLIYGLGDSVAVTAPVTIAGYNFLNWRAGDKILTGNPTINVVLDERTSLVASYVSVAEVILSIESNAPVKVTVSPADNNGATSGTAPCDFAYNSGTTVTITAPASVTRTWETGGTRTADFVRWCPDNTTNRTKSVIMNEDRVIRAVYPEVVSFVPSKKTGTCWMPLMLDGGDIEFGGNGPLVRFSLSVSQLNATTLMARAYAYAREYIGEYPDGRYGDSYGHATLEWSIRTLSDGSTIASFKSYTCSTSMLYVDETVDIDDCFSSKPCYWVKSLCIRGDTGGGDLSRPTDPCSRDPNSRTQVVTLEWNKVEYLRIPAPCD